MRIFVALAVVAFVQGAAPPAQQPPPQPGTAVVSGQVLDATTGKPVAGATVAMGAGAPLAVSGTLPLRPQGRVGVALTNNQGRFVFREVPAGEFSLTAGAANYLAGATGRKRIGGPGSTFTVKDGAHITDAIVRIWPFATISGVVRDDRGQPAVGVGVWAMRRTNSGGLVSYSFTGGGVSDTDDRGMYRISGLLPGSFAIGIRLITQSVPVATSDAYRAATASGTTSEVTRGWSETGALGIEGGGIVIDDFQVRVPSSQPPVLPGPNKTLLVHPQMFHPNASTSAEATPVELTAGEDRSGVDFRLPLVTGVRVSGVLEGPEGPLANAGIHLTPAASNGFVADTPIAHSLTDSKGRFAFLGIPSGSYVVNAYRITRTPGVVRPEPPAAGAPPGGNVAVREPAANPLPAIFAEVPITVGSANLDSLSIVMRPGARITGRVTFDGTPPAPAQFQRIVLVLRPYSGSDNSRNVNLQISADGSFTSPGIAPGRYLLSTGPMPAANSPGSLWALASAQIAGVDAAQQTVTIGSDDINGAIVALTERAIALSGSVRTADGAVSPDATIVVFPADTQAWIDGGMSVQRVFTAAANASGSYDCRVRLAGDYLVIALPPEIEPDVDAQFVKRYAASGVRVSLALGDKKTQALTMARVK